MCSKSQDQLLCRAATDVKQSTAAPSGEQTIPNLDVDLSVAFLAHDDQAGVPAQEGPPPLAHCPPLGRARDYFLRDSDTCILGYSRRDILSGRGGGDGGSRREGAFTTGDGDLRHGNR